MLSLLVSLLILVLILGICWWLISLVPIPPQYRWIVQLIFGIICLIVLLSMLTGYWSFPLGHPFVR